MRHVAWLVFLFFLVGCDGGDIAINNNSESNSDSDSESPIEMIQPVECIDCSDTAIAMAELFLNQANDAANVVVPANISVINDIYVDAVSRLSEGDDMQDVSNDFNDELNDIIEDSENEENV